MRHHLQFWFRALIIKLKSASIDTQLRMQTSVARRVLQRVGPARTLLNTARCQSLFMHLDSAISSVKDSVFEEEIVENVAIDLDTFLYGDETSFLSSGMSTELADAMQASGKKLPTIIQKKCYGAISSGQNAIVGAETGSGKTLAYLLPIIDQILRKNSEIDLAEATRYRSYPTAIIVVPNKELCHQVNRMALEVMRHLPILRQNKIHIGVVKLKLNLEVLFKTKRN